jgi:pantoate kinase
MGKNITNMESNDISKIMMEMQNFGDLDKNFTNSLAPLGGMSNFVSGNVTNMFKDIVENPSMENLMKTLSTFSEENDHDDDDVKEIKSLMQDILKEDLELKTAFDIMAFGMKLMTETDQERNE